MNLVATGRVVSVVRDKAEVRPVEIGPAADVRIAAANAVAAMIVVAKAAVPAAGAPSSP